MLISRVELEKIIEQQKAKYEKYNLKCIIKDLSDALIFSCVYGGIESVLEEKKLAKIENKKLVLIENVKSEKFEEIKKDKNVFAIDVYTLTSFDASTKLKLIFSSRYILFEKNSPDFSYSCEYFFENKNFTRFSHQKGSPLGKEKLYNEQLYGNLNNGIYFVETNEKTERINVCVFKLPNEKGNEDFFFSYDGKEDLHTMQKAMLKNAEMPFLEAVGVNSLSRFLSEAFENKNPVRIEDKMFFDQLKKASFAFYK